MSDDNIFRAKAIQIGSCGSPTCRSVHINLCDADGAVRAVADVDCEEMWAILKEMVDVTTELEGRSLLDLAPQDSMH